MFSLFAIYIVQDSYARYSTDDVGFHISMMGTSNYEPNQKGKLLTFVFKVGVYFYGPPPHNASYLPIYFTVRINLLYNSLHL